MTDRSLEIALHEERRLTGNQQPTTPSDQLELVILTTTKPMTYEEFLQAAEGMGYEPINLETLIQLSRSGELLRKLLGKPPIATVKQPDGSTAELYKP